MQVYKIITHYAHRSVYLVYRLYRSRTPFEYLGGDQATVNDCADETAILISSGGPGTVKIEKIFSSTFEIVLYGC